jgi:hypothetical protein
MHTKLRLAEIFHVLAHGHCSVILIWFPLSPHFVLLNIQHGILHSQRSPFLAGIDEHKTTHIDQGFISEDPVADILQETQWHCHCIVHAQNACPHIRYGKMACLHLLLTLLRAGTICTAFWLSITGIVVIRWIHCHLLTLHFILL